MESKDCILISDDEADEEGEISFADVSIQVIGHKKPVSKVPKCPAPPNLDASIIDLTNCDDSFMQHTTTNSYDDTFMQQSAPNNCDRSPASSPPLIPSPTPSPPLIPSPSPSPPPPLPASHAYESSRSSFTDVESPNFKRQQSTSQLNASPRTRPPKRPSPKSQSSPKLDKQARDEAKRMKMREKEEEKLQKEANRANAANKALQNCTAIVDKNVLSLLNDDEEIALRTLFDESMLTYRLSEYPKCENSISWSYKRTEVEDGHCVTKFKDADWILVVMDGGDYLKRVLTYRDNPDDSQSIKNYICDIRRRSKLDIILLVYNLANYLKSERMKDARNYRKNFKDKFEGRQKSNDKQQQQQQQQNGSSEAETTASNGIANIGTTDLQDLRLMFEVETKREHPDWKFHIEFYEKTQEVIHTIARYTSSIAKYEVKRKNKAVTNIDWAINMDKEKACDPTKSSEDLTKLWITQLQQFSQITLPIAKAIAAEYPSPSALLDQYKNLSTSEAESLLAELYVQRNLRRQIGPNISRRIHCFMTCRDPDVHIGYG